MSFSVKTKKSGAGKPAPPNIMRYWNNLVLVVLRNEQSADGQRDALAVGIDVDDLRLDLLALLQGVGSLLDTMVR